MKKTAVRITALVFFLTTGIVVGSWSADSPLKGEKRPEGGAVNVGPCRISVVGSAFWRSWMPIVHQPRPDRGSPLRAKVTFMLDNAAGARTQLSFRATIVDDKGSSHPATFRVMPDYRRLPDDVARALRTYDEPAKQDLLTKYEVVWDGLLKRGETREVTFVASDGPYVPAGSRVHIEAVWTDDKGNSATVKTADSIVERTD